MYLILVEICFFFEKILDVDNNYLNLDNYQIYSIEERQELINIETYGVNDFLLIPQMDRNEIVIKFLKEKCNKKLLWIQNKTQSFGKFHDYIEENHLVEAWRNYEKSELIKFASVWCEQNNIEFTIK